MAVSKVAPPHISRENKRVSAPSRRAIGAAQASMS